MFSLARKVPSLRLSTVLLTLAVPILGHTAYKWVDKDGIIHYSQFPPPDRKAKEVTLPAPTADSPVSKPESLEMRLQRWQQRQAERESTAAEKVREQEHSAAREHNCHTARENLKVYQGNPRWLISDGQGGYTRLSEAERQARLAETKRQIETNCD